MHVILVHVKLLEDKTKNRNIPKQNRKKKFQPLRKPDDSRPFDRTQSLSLFSSLKSEKSAKLGDVDFAHLAHTANFNGNTNMRSGLNPHSILTSLQSTDSNLGDTAFSFGSSKPSLAEEYLDPTKMTDFLPGPPQDLKAPLIEARFVVLSWRPPVNSDDIITYSVYYRQEGSER